VSLLRLLACASIAGACKRSVAPIPDAEVDDVQEPPTVRSVYPEVVDPDPLAARLCVALYTVPLERKAACCGTQAPGDLTGECTRAVTTALRDRSIAVDPGAVDRCAVEISERVAGCDWVTPLMPLPPPSCLGIIRGQLARNAACRSSLECVDGLHCRGVSPTTRGVCADPAPPPAACGGSADFLATHARQIDSDSRHPECAGACQLRTCVPFVEKGGACSSSKQCRPGHRCVGRVCVEGEHGAVGEPCLDRCVPDALCIAGKCVAPKPNGEPCASPFECKAACVKEPGRETGTCGKLCSYPLVRPTIPVPPPR
jgi:hypothetical protein